MVGAEFLGIFSAAVILLLSKALMFGPAGEGSTCVFVGASFGVICAAGLTDEPANP